MRRKDDFMRQDILEMRKKLDMDWEYCLRDEEISAENFEQGLKQVLCEGLKKIKWEQGFEDICSELDDGTKAFEKFKIVVREINDIIKDIKYYWRDLYADIYMGSLRADKAYDICYSTLSEAGWETRSCNRQIDVEKAKEHYPLVDYVDGDFITNGIPGGCREYHELMMRQGNIGFFDIESDKQSLKQYAYPNTHAIYKALKDSPIENLLLLEKTQGIGYTNQIFLYVKEITQKEQLAELEEIIRCIAKIPMFIRWHISNRIWEYLDSYNYDKANIQYIKEYIENVIYVVKFVYEKMWRFSWKELKEGKFPGRCLKGTLTMWWKEYFSEYEVYEYFNSSKGLHGFEDIEICKNKDTGEGKAEFRDSLIRCGDSGKVLLAMDGRGEEIMRVLGDKVRKARYRGESENDSSLTETLLTETVEELKAQEGEEWEKVDPKKATKKLNAMNIYAMIHLDIVKVLNK